MEERCAGEGAPADLLGVRHPLADAPLLLIEHHPLAGNSGPPAIPRDGGGTEIGDGNNNAGLDLQAGPSQGQLIAPLVRALGHRPPEGAGLRSPGAMAATCGGPEGGTPGARRFLVMCHRLRAVVACGRRDITGRCRLRAYKPQTPCTAYAAIEPACWLPLRPTGRRGIFGILGLSKKQSMRLHRTYQQRQSQQAESNDLRDYTKLDIKRAGLTENDRIIGTAGRYMQLKAQGAKVLVVT
jgi:hypothetical protein